MNYQRMQVSEELHNRFVMEVSDRSFMQTSYWAKLKQLNQWQSERIDVGDGEKILACAQILYRRVGFWRIAYAPRAYLVSLDEPALLEALHREVLQFCKKEKIAALSIDPLQPVEDLDRLLALYKPLGFQHEGLSTNLSQYFQPRFTMEVALPDSDEALFAMFPGRTRSTIRRAESYELIFRDLGPEGLEAFSELMRITGERDKFSIRDISYFRALFDAFGEEHIHLFGVYVNPAKALAAELRREAEILKILRRQEKKVARNPELSTEVENLRRSLEKSESVQKVLREAGDEEILLASAIYLNFGRYSFYMYGASSQAIAEVQPCYFLQWELMKRAISDDALIYDLGGIDGDLTGDNGLYEFKQRFGTQIYETLGQFVLPLKRLSWASFQASLWLRKFIYSLRH
ncbi:MAG: peptidoglycan bridge formation glycyltransferase FemA/FemB family protein [Eubacteriales bacterium]|nr:peptidoglycan bridge formation glycyltransferase FemA/FemB family protein [Eubacteriales bacterium]